MSGITRDLARTCIERGFKKADALGFKVAIAVVDEAGHLVVCERMDGALWVTPEIARAKANAAAGFRTTTLDLEERFAKRMIQNLGSKYFPWTIQELQAKADAASKHAQVISGLLKEARNGTPLPPTGS